MRITNPTAGTSVPILDCRQSPIPKQHINIKPNNAMARPLYETTKNMNDRDHRNVKANQTAVTNTAHELKNNHLPFRPQYRLPCSPVFGDVSAIKIARDVPKQIMLIVSKTSEETSVVWSNNCACIRGSFREAGTETMDTKSYLVAIATLTIAGGKVRKSNQIARSPRLARSRAMREPRGSSGHEN